MSSPRRRTVLVTGCAGFIGSTLCERLLERGDVVRGVDVLTDYYSRELKRGNLVQLLQQPRFEYSDIDLSSAPLEHLFEGVDVVIHLAGQAGVRASFGKGFSDYVKHNVLATQRLLEAAAVRNLERFVYASSSSVYGDAAAYPTSEACDRQPVSPYGLTKVATEDLASVYFRTRGVPVVGLRYFTVYGPRQRPDMAFARFLARALAGESLPIFGDGRQVRDFTFVEDIVAGTIASADFGHAGGVYNLGGGHPVELREVIATIGELIGREVPVERRPSQPGEARRTSADCSLAFEHLGWQANTLLRPGLAAQLAWTQELGPASRSHALAA